VRDDVNFKTVDHLSVFIPRIFESLTIELTINKKKLAVTSVYRSPTPPPQMSITDHIAEFSNHLDHHLSNLNNSYPTSYVCLDSNIYQLITNINHPSHEYFQTIEANGFVQCIQKATRIIGAS
jgi:hypothetical protein